MQRTVTVTDDDVLAAVREYVAQHGYPPSMRELGSMLGLRSSSTVWRHLDRLRQQGRLRNEPHQPRTMAVVGWERERVELPYGREGRRPLTQRQRAVLDFVVTYLNERGFPPSVRDVAKGIGVTSSSTAWSHLVSLVAKGYLEWDPGRPRTLRPAALAVIAHAQA